MSRHRWLCLLGLSWGCSGSVPPASQGPMVDSVKPAPALPSVGDRTGAAATCACRAALPAPEPGPEPSATAPAPTSSASIPTANPVDPELVAQATGTARGGPRGTRRCEFRESVDTYRRTCRISLEPDGSLLVNAPGTELNPAHGFRLSMHGGPHRFAVKGQLDAFDLCTGPFHAYAVSVIDNGATTYEIRLNAHCMIVIR